MFHTDFCWDFTSVAPLLLPGGSALPVAGDMDWMQFSAPLDKESCWQAAPEKQRCVCPSEAQQTRKKKSQTHSSKMARSLTWLLKEEHALHRDSDPGASFLWIIFKSILRRSKVTEIEMWCASLLRDTVVHCRCFRLLALWRIFSEKSERSFWNSIDSASASPHFEVHL